MNEIVSGLSQEKQEQVQETTLPIDVIILKNIFRRARGEEPIPMPKENTDERVSTRFPKPLK